MELLVCSKINGEGVHRYLTNTPGVSGAAGVVNDKLILFRPLW